MFGKYEGNVLKIIIYFFIKVNGDCWVDVEFLILWGWVIVWNFNKYIVENFNNYIVEIMYNLY